jgi:hypothetical protein
MNGSVRDRNLRSIEWYQKTYVQISCDYPFKLSECHSDWEGGTRLTNQNPVGEKMVCPYQPFS